MGCISFCCFADSLKEKAIPQSTSAGSDAVEMIQCRSRRI